MSPADTERVDQFHLISRLLVDSDELDTHMAAVYLGMVDDLSPQWPLDEMATAFAPLEPLPTDQREHRVVALLQGDEAFMDAAKAVLNVWYSGQLIRADGVTMVPGPSMAYLGALVWGLTGTHASGVPGPYFGEWAYPPSRDRTWVSSPSASSGSRA